MSAPLSEEELSLLERRAHVVLECGATFEYGHKTADLCAGMDLFAEDALRAVNEIRRVREQIAEIQEGSYP
jgi:hypothetical protein